MKIKQCLHITWKYQQGKIENAHRVYVTKMPYRVLCSQMNKIENEKVTSLHSNLVSSDCGHPNRQFNLCKFKSHSSNTDTGDRRENNELLIYL